MQYNLFLRMQLLMQQLQLLLPVLTPEARYWLQDAMNSSVRQRTMLQDAQRLARHTLLLQEAEAKAQCERVRLQRVVQHQRCLLVKRRSRSRRKRTCHFSS